MENWFEGVDETTPDLVAELFGAFMESF